MSKSKVFETGNNESLQKQGRQASTAFWTAWQIPSFNRSNESDTTLLPQPETRPITQGQLIKKVKGIYAGLVVAEKKCIEIDQQQSQTTNKLSREKWQSLIAHHRTLLYEHHDFLLASQYPSASPALRRRSTKYVMPARIWRHAIHSVLARPTIVQQLYYSSKALFSVVRFFKGLMLLFSPLREETASQRHELGEANFVKTYGILFTNGGIERHMEGLIRGLDHHITRTSAKFYVQGPEFVLSMITTSLIVDDLSKHTSDVKKNGIRPQCDRMESHLCQHQSMGAPRKRPDRGEEDVHDTEVLSSEAKRQYDKPYWMHWRIEIDLRTSFLSRVRRATLCFALMLFIQPVTADNIDMSLGVRRPVREATKSSQIVEIHWWLIAVMSCCVLLGLVLWQAEFTPRGHGYHPNRSAQIASGLSVLVLWVLVDADSFAPLQFFLQVTNIGNLAIFWRSVFPSRSRNMRIVTAILIPGFTIATMLSLPPSSDQGRASTRFSQILYAFLWLVLSLLECILDPPKRNENQLPDEERGASSALEPEITSLGDRRAVEAGPESTVESSGTGASEDQPQNPLAAEQEQATMNSDPTWRELLTRARNSLKIS